MTPAQIISIATRRTGNRGNNSSQLDINSELLTAIIGLTKACKWKWRNQSISVPLVPVQKLYDLSVIAPDYQEMSSLKIVIDPATTPTLNEVWDSSEQGAILEGSDPGQPDRYFVNGAYGLNVYPVPDGVSGLLPLRMAYWAVPVTVLDATGALLPTVPLVPPYLHDVVVKGLEKQILRFTVGAEDAKYQLTAAEYDTAMKQAWGV